jgi:tetratricopeptide (TPR) repeat protein
LTNVTFLDNEVSQEGYYKKANPVTMKNILNKSKRIILLIVLLFLFSCPSTHQEQTELKGAGAYFNRGCSYMIRRQYEQAISDFNKALEISPKYAEAYYNRGYTYYLKEEYEKSWEDINKAQDLGLKVPPKFLDDLRKASGRQN